MQKQVPVEGHRWAIEDSFETAKNELGLDHNEARSWHGWHRHVSLVRLAFAVMAVMRRRRKAIRPVLDLDRRHCQAIIIEIGSRLRDFLSRERIALPPRLERLLQALDDQERSHSRGWSGGERSN
jgi:hypothetical protein